MFGPSRVEREEYNGYDQDQTDNHTQENDGHFPATAIH